MPLYVTLCWVESQTRFSRHITLYQCKIAAIICSWFLFVWQKSQCSQSQHPFWWNVSLTFLATIYSNRCTLAVIISHPNRFHSNPVEIQRSCVDVCGCVCLWHCFNTLEVLQSQSKFLKSFDIFNLCIRIGTGNASMSPIHCISPYNYFTCVFFFMSIEFPPILLSLWARLFYLLLHKIF